MSDATNQIPQITNTAAMAISINHSISIEYYYHLGTGSTN